MKEPAYYAEIGYEDHGYVSPELSSSDTYPDYLRAEADESVREILSHQSEDTVTFAFMTDLHLAHTDNHRVRMQRTVNTYKDIARRVRIDRLILGGDYTNEGCKQYKSECYRDLRQIFSGLDYYPVHGNHDDGTIWDISYIKADTSANHLTHSDLYALFYDHLPSIGANIENDGETLYYYVNDEATKTRYIFLDSGDIPYIYDDNGKLLYSGQWTFTMSQRQLEWVINTALKFDEEGWSVAFFTHCFSMPLGTNPKHDEMCKGMTVINGIIDAYKRSEKFSMECGEAHLAVKVEADFTSGIKADVIGCFGGDYHTDRIEFSDTGVPYVLTGNAVMYFSSNPIYKVRTDGDKSELLFDVITVDKKTRKIYITRVGVGDDREASY